MLALDRGVRQGMDLRHLFNIYEGVSGLVRFHGVRRELIQAQADALGRDLVQDHTHPDDYPAVLDRVLEELRRRGVGGIAFGNIHLSDIRGWYEERTLGRGFDHQEPLWGTTTAAVLDEFVARGYRARIVSVNLESGRREWLGRELDGELVAELKATPGIDLAGERGEYHSFVYDGPLFQEPVVFREGPVFEREGHLIQDLVPE
jgi:uncharacterized protein (TIGR00290 family)